MKDIFPAIIFVWCLLLVLRKRRNAKENPTESTRSLTTNEKIQVWILCIFQPLWGGAIFYYGWRRPLPTMAKQANKISFIAFFIELVLLICFAFVLYKTGNIPVDNKITTTSDGSSVSCAVTNKGDKLVDESVYDGPSGGPSSELTNLTSRRDGTWDVSKNAVSPKGYFLICSYKSKIDDYGNNVNHIDIPLTGYTLCSFTNPNSESQNITCAK